MTQLRKKVAVNEIEETLLQNVLGFFTLLLRR